MDLLASKSLAFSSQISICALKWLKVRPTRKELLAFPGSHQTNVATLRRASMKPPPPARRSSSVMSNNDHNGSNGLTTGSNSTTPRSSMEHLPPPPPHLLHSDDDDQPLPPPPNNANAQRPPQSRSVAESIKALQNSGHLPCSPKSLRRAHSMMGPNSSSGPREQIYAPVAHLQQKIQQRQQQQQQHFNYPEPGGDQYGFGMQFQQTQSQYYQQMVDAGLPMQSPPESATQASYGMANHDQVPNWKWLNLRF